MGKFLEWFCGKKETTTSRQFANMMKTVEQKAIDTEKKKEEEKQTR